MNILFLSRGIDTMGGVEKFITTLSNNWSENNTIFIYSMYGDEKPAYELNESITVFYPQLQNEKRRWRKWFSIYTQLMNIVKNNGIELIIGETIETSSVAALVANRNGILSVGYEHYNYVEHKGKLEILRKYFYPKLSFFVPASPIEISSYEKYNCNVEFIANPISLDIENCYNPSSKKILNIGRLDYVKGHEILIEAFNLVNKKYPDYSLTIVGKDFGEKEKLEKLVVSYNLQNNITFIEGTNRIKEFFRESLFFVLPSREEGFSMVMLESMAMGVPILATDCVGPSFLIKDGVNGFLSEKNNADKLAKKMIFILDNKDDLSKISKKQNETASNYTMNNISKTWNQCLASFGVKID
ncbi:glycosyltransferase [Vibrio cholerae]|nr:glycosyltransferase [Vibrio cholerae]EGQ8662243.1 glycosyltransferase [Vibrio cholerae]